MTNWITKGFTFLISVFSVDRKWLIYAEKLEQRLDAQDAKLDDCKREHALAQLEIVALRREVAELKQEIKELRGESNA